MAVLSVNNSNNRFTLKLTLTEGNPNTEKNTSPVDYKLELLSNTSWDFALYQIGRKVVLNGTTVYEVTRANSTTFDLPPKSSITLATGSTTITHDNDGSKTISVSYSIDMKKADWTPGALSGTGTMKLSTIPRATTPTVSPEEVILGNNLTIALKRAAESFTHKLTYIYGTDEEIELGSDIGTSFVWENVPVDFALYHTDSATGQGKIKAYTYNGDSLIGVKEVVFKTRLEENEDTKPTLGWMEIGGYMSDSPKWLDTEYIQGLTKLKAGFNSAEAKMGADIASYTVSIDGVEKTVKTSADSYAMYAELLKPGEDVEVIGYVTDTRGFKSAERKATITIIPYDKPILAHHSGYGEIMCKRCTEAGALAHNGRHLKLIVKGKWYSLSQQENEGNIQVKCKSDEGHESDWVTVYAEAQGGGAENGYISYVDINTVVDGVELDVDNVYTVTVRCVDAFGNDTDLPFSIPSQKVTFHLADKGKGAAFGKYFDPNKENAVEVAEDWSFDVLGDLILKGNTIADSIVEYNADDEIWKYIKLASGVVFCWGKVTETIGTNTAVGSSYVYTGATHALPSGLFKTIDFVTAKCLGFSYGDISLDVVSIAAISFHYKLLTQRENFTNTTYALLIGTWE